MEIRLIAIDMDGTLLDPSGNVSPKNKKAVQAAVAAGIYVVPATGRPRSILPPALMTLQGIHYAVTSNGAAVLDWQTGASIASHCLTTKQAVSVVQAVRPYHSVLEVYIAGESYLEEHIYNHLDDYPIPEYFKPLYYSMKKAVGDVLDLIEQKGGVEKFNIPWLSLDCKEAMQSKLEAIDGLALTSSFDNNIEINREGVNKGLGIQSLCDHLNISPKQVMAIGDSSNDYEMLRTVGLPIAMGNAEEHIKELAHAVTATNEEDGVAKAIYQFCNLSPDA